MRFFWLIAKRNHISMLLSTAINRYNFDPGTAFYYLTISGNNQSRIFNLFDGNIFTLKTLTLKNAVAATNGGAIYVKGNLNLENVLL